MVRLRGGTYYTWIQGHLIVLFHIRCNESRLYIDGSFKGRVPFQYTKAKIQRLQHHDRRKGLHYNGCNIWQEGQRGLFVHVRV